MNTADCGAYTSAMTITLTAGQLVALIHGRLLYDGRQYLGLCRQPILNFGLCIGIVSILDRV